MEEVLEVVVVDEFLGEYPSREPHVLVLIHVRRQIKILDVDGHEFSAWCRNHTIKKYFGSGDVCIGGEGLTSKMDLVTTDRDSDAVRIGFLGTILTHNPGISCFFMRWFGSMVDEVGGVGSHEAALFASLG